MKVLGFMFGTQPGVEAHIQYIEEKFRKNIWALIHLRKAKLKDSELLQVYTSVVRAAVEFCAPVYTSMLNGGQKEAWKPTSESYESDFWRRLLERSETREGLA